MNSRINAIIVDDEELARRGLEIRLREHPDIAVVAHCENGRVALETVAREKPDLMFLDIQMPGIGGFDVLAGLPQNALPLIVFVTAFDRYALAAFEAQALDYLLKPINEVRFRQTLDRVRVAWRQRDSAAECNRLMRLLAATQGTGTLAENTPQAELQERPCQTRVLPIRTGEETVRLQIDSIDWIDAAGDYMCVHAGGQTHVLRETMKSLQAVLDPEQFQRVHRSTIVNIDRVRRLRPHTNGEYFLTLDDGQEIKLSRSYRDCVDRLLRRR